MRQFCVLAIFCVRVVAQSTNIAIQPPKPMPLGALFRPYQQRIVPPINLGNSSRLQALIHAGNLYLTAQDVIALTLENNIDIEIQRYGPLLSGEVVRRAEGGGALRNVGLAVLAGPASVSLAGVSVSAIQGNAGAGINSGGGIVTQIGPNIPNLDPQFIAYANFAHTTSPESNTLLAQTSFLVNETRLFQLAYAQSFLPGTSVQLSFSSSRSLVNSPSSLLNPATSGNVDLYMTQNLLQGFGRSVNNRNIRVARNNAKVTDLELKQQVITTISAVLNLYWDLVSFDEDVRLKEQALAAAQKLYDDNKKELQIGVVATIDVTRAEAEVPAREQDLLAAQTNVLQQETVLKSALSRHGMEDPLLEQVHVIPLDHFQVPEKEELKPAKDLVAEALVQRPDLQQAKINIESTLLNLIGSRNALRPTLQAFAEFTNHALAGVANPLNLNDQYGAANPYYEGGYGNFLGQIFRRNFPDYSVGFSLNIPFRNRPAQADYATDQLNLRTLELQLQRSINQVGVDVRNAIIELQQAHARFENAVRTRKLAEETLKAEQMKYQLGDSTVFLVIQAQRDLVTAQDDEVQAMANYTHARIAFEQALGATLETNHISMAEAFSGRVQRQSSIPETVVK